LFKLLHVLTPSNIHSGSKLDQITQTCQTLLVN